MEDLYGKPNIEKTDIIEWRYLDSPKFLEMPDGSGLSNPTHEDFIEAGWLLYAVPVVGRYQIKGGHTLDFPNKTYTHAVIDNPDIDIIEELIAFTKLEAGRRILEILPEWKQRNLNARATELQEIRHEVGLLTDEESAELAAIWSAFRDQIKPIRTASDLIEAEITGEPDKPETITIKTTIEVKTSVLWP